MGYIKKGFAWIEGRYRLRVDVSRQIARLIKKHEASSSAEETLKVLLNSAVSWLVFDIESEDDMAIYLERLAHRLRDDTGRGEV